MGGQTKRTTGMVIMWSDKLQAAWCCFIFYFKCICVFVSERCASYCLLLSLERESASTSKRFRMIVCCLDCSLYGEASCSATHLHDHVTSLSLTHAYTHSLFLCLRQRLNRSLDTCIKYSEKEMKYVMVSIDPRVEMLICEI